MASLLARPPTPAPAPRLLLRTGKASRAAREAFLPRFVSGLTDKTWIRCSAPIVEKTVIVRCAPDVAEVRVLCRDAFSCRAICAELAGKAIGIKDIADARTVRRRGRGSMLAQWASATRTIGRWTGMLGQWASAARMAGRRTGRFRAIPEPAQKPEGALAQGLAPEQGCADDR
jgi:hypothetical protein